MKKAFTTISHEVDVCVVGGGLAGLCAAIAAARQGASTLIMQERPMFGGNASSEIRMWVCGAHGENNRETGLIEEIMLESFYRNPYANYTLWDSILYEKVRFQQDLAFLLNCSCLDAEMEGNKISSVRGWQMTTQQYHEVKAKIFIDCSGDSILAPLTGAEFRLGREGRSEFGEDIAPAAADQKTMGMSCLIQAREHQAQRPFTAPFWAEKLTAEDLPHRLPDPYERNENYWYLELGGDQDSIADTEDLRDELQDIAYGMWDFIKNSGHYDEKVDRLDLDWIGILPGKRESRRYVGDVLMNQHDVSSQGKFPDLVAYGGWSMDDHHPAGFRTKELPTIHHPAPSPFGIPYRSLYSINIANLMFAGRNISVTHAALSATRVMATCATLGQAAGTAAALAVEQDCSPRGVYEKHLALLQKTLMDDDCYLPFNRRLVPELTLQSKLEAGGTGAENLRNGYDRPIGADENCWTGQAGDQVTYHLPEATVIQQLRLIFDSDLNRQTLPYKGRYNRPQQASYYLSDQPVHVPQTMLKDFLIQLQKPDGSWATVQDIKGNYQRLVRFDLSQAGPATAVRFVPLASWGGSKFRVFSFDVN